MRINTRKRGITPTRGTQTRWDLPKVGGKETTMVTLNLGFKKKAKQDTDLDVLLRELGKRRLPRRVALALPSVIRSSYRAYTSFWATVQEEAAKGGGGAEGRLLAKVIETRFLSPPKWFVLKWVAAVVAEAEWRKASPKKWGVWSPTNPLFVQAGEAEAVLYCGDPTRFTALMRSLR